MNGTSINARNWVSATIFYVVKWVYHYFGLGVAQTSRAKGCLWRGFLEMTAEESKAGQDKERGRTYRFG